MSGRRSRRRRLLEQFDEHAPGLSRRELVRSVEAMLERGPIARGLPWPAPYERGPRALPEPP